jgi:hypothetical protein
VAISAETGKRIVDKIFVEIRLGHEKLAASGSMESICCDGIEGVHACSKLAEIFRGWKCL